MSSPERGEADAAGAGDVVVKLENLLWRTRGRHWDYEFVLRPREPAWGEWYQLYRDVFDGLTPDPHDAAPTLRHGYVIAPPQLWIATAFYDAEQRDEAGRAILHGLVWFPPARDHPRLASIPRDWGVQVLRAFASTTARAWALTRAELTTPHAACALYEQAATERHEIALQGPRAPLEGEGLGVLIKKKPDARLRRGVSSWLLVGAALLMLLAALLSLLR